MDCYNPIKEAFTETRNAFNPNARISSVVSIGSGTHETHKLRQATKDGLNETLCHMILGCDIVAEEVTKSLSKVLEYQRLSVDKEMDKVVITAWGKDDIKGIAGHTKDYMKRKNGVVDQVVQNLLNRSERPLPTIGNISQCPSFRKITYSNC